MKGTILLVDDNASDRELAEIALEQIGLAQLLVTVGSAQAALDYLDGRDRPVDHGLQPALVLLDLRMPGMDGHDFLAALRKREPLRSVPVVVFSASAEASDIARSYALGACGYVVKPLRFDDLVALLGRVCGFWIEANQPPPESARVLGPASARPLAFK